MLNRAAAAQLPAKTYGSARDGSDTLSRALGWFSIGLGLAQLVAPAHVARMAGVTALDVLAANRAA